MIDKIKDLLSNISGKTEDTQPAPAETKRRGIRMSYASNVGYVRRGNEDNFFVESAGTRNQPDVDGQLILPNDCGIAAVCDGMGGEDFGAEAAAIGVETISTYAEKLNDAEPEALSALVHACAQEANDKICRMVQEKGGGRSGCTMVLLCVKEKQGYVFSIGDSRVYAMQLGALRQVTNDQTVAAEKVKAGILTELEAAFSPDRHGLTAFLGMDETGGQLAVQTYPAVDLRGTTMLLCSDGLTEMCSDAEIAAILSAAPEQPARALMRAALAHGGVDNTTCVVVSLK